MKLIDLFAGSRSVAKVAEEKGWQTFSTDIEPYDKIDLVKNILDVSPKDFPFVPDIIWASPPCTCFSVSSIGKHWTKEHTCKTPEAKEAISIAIRARQLIGYFKIKNPKLIWFVENPRGKLRKLNIFESKFLKTVCYCQYGETRMKPTDIWTNSINWIPRPMCFNGNTNCHHVPAPRGSQTGTQGMKNAYEKSKIPKQLVEEILNAEIQ